MHSATNRPEILDKALLRPGRFDRRIPVELPDIQGRQAILEVHAKKVQMGDVDLNVITELKERQNEFKDVLVTEEYYRNYDE